MGIPAKKNVYEIKLYTRCRINRLHNYATLVFAALKTVTLIKSTLIKTMVFAEHQLKSNKVLEQY